MEPMVKDDYATVAQAAKILGCTTGRVRQLLIAKTLPGEKMSPTLWLIPRDKLAAFKKNLPTTGRPRNGQ